MEAKFMKNNKRLTTEEFIERSKAIYGDRYEYSKTKYINNKTPVVIKCKIHGEFSIRPDVHLFGKHRRGCQECGRIRDREYSKNISVQHGMVFVERARKIHGNKYDYSKVNYIKSNCKTTIICKECGQEFEQTPNKHLQGKGCPYCANKNHVKRLAAINRSSKEEFIEKARKVHGNKYDYSKIEYENSHSKICIICPEHGEFWQSPNEHLRGSGCWLCSESHGEREIRKWFDEHGIEYIREKEFDGLVGVGGGKLRFDFYLPKHNICVEFDGIQHRKFIKGMQTKKEFEDILEHDRRKNEFCSKNGIKLIRIWRDDEGIKKEMI